MFCNNHLLNCIKSYLKISIWNHFKSVWRFGTFTFGANESTALLSRTPFSNVTPSSYLSWPWIVPTSTDSPVPDLRAATETSAREGISATNRAVLWKVQYPWLIHECSALVVLALLDISGRICCSTVNKFQMTKFCHFRPNYTSAYFLEIGSSCASQEARKSSKYLLRM